MRTWRTADLAAPWRPAPCLGWQGALPDRLVALAGRFAHRGGAAALITRFGAVSGLRGLEYWSPGDRRWQPLILEAWALSGPEPGLRRPDFALGELPVGAIRYFAQRDNRSSGATVFRLTVRWRSPTRVVLHMVNVNSVTFWGMPMFAAGALQSVYILQRLGPGAWGYYSLSGSAEPAVTVLLDLDDSYRNRAVALFRHVSDLPRAAAPRFGRAPGGSGGHSGTKP